MVRQNLHKLEALLLVADSQRILLISGNGEVIEPDDGVLAIGSGGNYALASARALMQTTDLSAREIAEKIGYCSRYLRLHQPQRHCRRNL